MSDPLNVTVLDGDLIAVTVSNEAPINAEFGSGVAETLVGAAIALHMEDPDAHPQYELPDAPTVQELQDRVGAAPRTFTVDNVVHLGSDRQAESVYVEKTVGTGKDFETLDDALDWLLTLNSPNAPLDNTTSVARTWVVLVLDDGVHTLKPRQQSPSWWGVFEFSYVDVTIRGTSRAGTVITLDAAWDIPNGNYLQLFVVFGTFFELSTLTIDIEAGGWTSPGDYTFGAVLTPVGAVNYANIYNVTMIGPFGSALYATYGSYTRVQGLKVVGAIQSAIVALNGSQVTVRNTYEVVDSFSAATIYDQGVIDLSAATLVYTNVDTPYNSVVNQLTTAGAIINDGPLTLQGDGVATNYLAGDSQWSDPLGPHLLEADPHPQYETDGTAAAAVSAHEAAGDPHPQYEDDGTAAAAVSAHEAAVDPHPQYAPFAQVSAEELEDLIETELRSFSPADLEVAASRTPSDQHVFGFLPGHTETTISFNESTYEFTLAPTGTEWSYYRHGSRFTITGPKTVTLSGSPPATGQWFVYIDSDDGTLIASTTPWSLGPTSTVVFVALVEFNDALTPKYLLYDERHPADLTRGEHAYLHRTQGSQYSSGGILANYTLQDGTANSSIMFSANAGTIYDETLPVAVAEQTQGNGVDPVYLLRRRNGSGGWTWAQSAVPFLFSPDGYIYVDSPAGTLTQAANNNYVNTWVLLTSAGYQYVMPQQIHASLAAAQAADYGALDLAGLTVEEFVAVAKITWRTGSSYSTSGKVRIEAIETLRISSVPAAVQPLSAAAISVSATPANYTPTTGTVEGHLSGIDTELASFEAAGAAAAAVSAHEAAADPHTQYEDAGAAAAAVSAHEAAGDPHPGYALETMFVGFTSIEAVTEMPATPTEGVIYLLYSEA